MYRDDPLDDEAELRAIIGDDQVDTLVEATTNTAAVYSQTPLEAALDLMRLLQGWADEASIANWLTQPQQRLNGETPLNMLCQGSFDDVDDAARAWVASRG
jgi:hypothetical protein